MKKNLALVMAWIVVVNLFGLVTLNRINMSGDTAYKWLNPSTTIQDKTWNITDLHSRWDSFFYIDIASNGYYQTPGEALSNIVFFPLYPLLIGIFSIFTFNNYALTAWFISLFSLIGAVLFLNKFIKKYHPGINPHTTALYLLIFPTSFFLNAVYTESLFLLLSLATFYYAKKSSFWLSGLFGMLAALTRVTGVLLFLPVAWELWVNRKKIKALPGKVIATLLIPTGTTLFFLYHYFKFNDITLFFKVQSAWGRSFSVNQSHLSFFSSAATANFVLDTLFVVFSVSMIVLSFRKKWTSYGIYMLSTVAVALSTGTLMSIGRYILVLFPMFIIAASIKNETFQKVYPMFSTLLLALYILLFVNGYWAG